MNAKELNGSANGSVIKVKRWGGVYDHYGVYVNDGREESVIHYTDDKGKKDFKGKVCETSLEEFLDGASLEDASIKSFNGRVYSGKETVERARSKLGDEDYSLFSNNCEHMATWCKTGKKESSQVKMGTIGVAASLGAAAFLGGAALVAAGGGKKGD